MTINMKSIENVGMIGGLEWSLRVLGILFLLFWKQVLHMRGAEFLISGRPSIVPFLDIDTIVSKFTCPNLI